MLIKLINKVFLNNLYEVVPLEHNYDYLMVELYKPKILQKKAEYYLVVECTDATQKRAELLLSEWAENLYQKVRTNPNIDRVFSKNCTMIVCWPDNAITDKQIFQLEEDRYNFKKNVITYCLDELDDLEAKGGDFTIAKMNEMISEDDGNVFKDFKEGTSGLKSHYSLLLKIFIKLPFVTYQHDSKRLSNLDSSLIESLSQNELPLYEFTQGLSNSLTDEELMDEFLKRAN